MSRRVIAFDRLIIFVIGLCLVVIGAGLVVWWSGNLDSISSPFHAHAVHALDQRSWWSWATGGAGLVLVFGGLRWMIAHVNSNRVKSLSINGSSPKGRLKVDTDAVLDAAASVFKSNIGVRSVRGRTVRDRGQLVAVLDATMEPTANISEIGKAADAVAGDLQTALGRDDIHCRINLSVASHGKSLSRVD